ncbi:MAG: GTP cyclohydrolase I [Euryarchaeota archaeon]|nr:GTP cyclohydrolase I [Euryarchaeota archaeon]
MIRDVEHLLDRLSARIGNWRDKPEMNGMEKKVYTTVDVLDRETSMVTSRHTQESNGRSTPARFVDALLELTEGYESDLPFNMTTFDTTHDDMVVLTGLPIASLCAHHMLPWIGKADLAYIPGEAKLGLSKFPRYVRFKGHQLSSQEELTGEIADGLVKALKEPRGVYLIITAIHTCVVARGAMEDGASTTTAAVRGVFKEDGMARDEARDLMRREYR